jgi:copper chaperone CopZ
VGITPQPLNNPDYVQPDATGTKIDTPVMETPLNVKVIIKQVLKDQQVINLDQALKNVSGVTSEDVFLAPTLKWNISPRVSRRPWNLSTRSIIQPRHASLAYRGLRHTEPTL